MIDVERYLAEGLPWASSSNVEDPFAGVENTGCSICMDDIEPANMNSHSAVTRCGHVFHTTCLAQYFVQLLRGGNSAIREPESPRCPNCRESVADVWTTAKWCHENTWQKIYSPNAARRDTALVEIQFNRRSPVAYNMPSATSMSPPIPQVRPSIPEEGNLGRRPEFAELHARLLNAVRPE